MNEIDQKRAAKVANLLKEGFNKFFASEIAKGRPVPSQNDYSRWLGIPPTSMSAWINEIRLPTGDNIDAIATRLGPEIYEILGVPPRMPKDKLLNFIAAKWHKLDEAKRKQLAELVDNWTFENQKSGEKV